MCRERPGHTLQPTALVHEAYIKLVDQSRVNWRGRTQFFAVGAGHLGGEEGVIALLREAGYSVTPVME